VIVHRRLLTNLPPPASGRAQQVVLAEVVRLYGLRNWVEQGYKQVKGELGWADFQVRSDRAIRRHWTLVCCAFSFCWQAVLAEHPTQPAAAAAAAARSLLLGRGRAARIRTTTARSTISEPGRYLDVALARPARRAPGLGVVRTA
jgi:hypothetical protein